MPPVIITNSALVTLEGRYDNQQIVNVFCFVRDAGPPSTADIDNLALWWGNTGWGLIKPILSDQYTLFQIKVKNVHFANGYEHDVSPTGIQRGNLGGDPLPGQNSMCVSWRTSAGGRSYRGRTYIGPLSEQQINGNYAGSGYMTLLASWASSMLTARPTGGWRLAVGSRKLHVGTDVISAAIDAIVDSTDRRKPGRGT